MLTQQSNDEQRAESDDIGGPPHSLINSFPISINLFLLGTEGDDDDGDGDEAGEAVPEKLRTLHGLVIQYAAKVSLHEIHDIREKTFFCCC